LAGLPVSPLAGLAGWASAPAVQVIYRKTARHRFGTALTSFVVWLICNLSTFSFELSAFNFSKLSPFSTST